MLNRFIILFSFLLGAIHALAQQEPLTCSQDTLIMETSTGRIFGTLLQPVSGAPVPLVLIIAGSGPTDRNGNNPMMVNNSLKYLAGDLCREGIASLRYDKRGIGESKDAGIEEAGLRFDHYIQDASGWINRLQKNQAFSKVIVIGHSEGSLIGMIAARNTSPAGFISIAGTGRPADELIKKQLEKQPEQVREYSYPILDSLKAGITVDSINTMYYPLFRPSVQPYLISWFQYDPQKEISKLDVPILIIQGSTDIQVSEDDAYQLLVAGKNVEMEIIEGMNHILKKAGTDRQQNIATYQDPDMPIMQELIEAIVYFINNRT